MRVFTFAVAIAVATLLLPACSQSPSAQSVPAIPTAQTSNARLAQSASTAPTPAPSLQGAVTTFASIGTGGWPFGVAVDGGGNVYAPDTNNGRILKITPAGIVSMLAGNPQGASGYHDGSGTAALFSGPQGVAVDILGNVYVADSANNRIRKITPAGVVTTLAGTGTAGYLDGVGATARFSNPTGLAVDSNSNVYVVDNSNRIRKITSAGMVSTFAGSGVVGFKNAAGTAAQFADPSGVAVDAKGNVYVADTMNNMIRFITPAGFVTTFAGTGAPGYADGIGYNAQFVHPDSLVVDAAGNIYVSELAFGYPSFGGYGIPGNQIRKVTGLVTTPGILQGPAMVSTLAGSLQGASGYKDGIGTAALFSNPTGVTVDVGGNLYVADAGNNRIRKIQTVNSSIPPTPMPTVVPTALPAGISVSPKPASISCQAGTPFCGQQQTITLSEAGYAGPFYISNVSQYSVIQKHTLYSASCKFNHQMGMDRFLTYTEIDVMAQGPATFSIGGNGYPDHVQSYSDNCTVTFTDKLGPTGLSIGNTIQIPLSINITKF